MKITALATATIVGFSSVTLGASGYQSNQAKRQDDPYNIHWSFLSAKSGDDFDQKDIHPDGLWHQIREPTPGDIYPHTYKGMLREGGADADLARCFFDDHNTEVKNGEFLFLPDEGLIGYAICCYYETKDNGLEPDKPNCCLDQNCKYDIQLA